MCGKLARDPASGPPAAWPWHRRPARAAAFLDVAVLDSGGTTLGYGALTPPESDSSYTAPGVLTSPEADLPATLIPPAIAARANDLLRQLDYPILPELG